MYKYEGMPRLQKPNHSTQQLYSFKYLTIILSLNMSFDALPRRFSISIDGKPVAMPKGQIEEQTQAQAVGFGNDDGPAIFEIQDEHLVSGPFVMGRFFVEDRSLMPKRVSWFNRERMDQVQPVHVEFGEKGPEIKLRGILFLMVMRYQSDDLFL